MLKIIITQKAPIIIISIINVIVELLLVVVGVSSLYVNAVIVLLGSDDSGFDSGLELESGSGLDFVSWLGSESGLDILINFVSSYVFIVKIYGSISILACLPNSVSILLDLLSI